MIINEIGDVLLKRCKAKKAVALCQEAPAEALTQAKCLADSSDIETSKKE